MDDGVEVSIIIPALDEPGLEDLKKLIFIGMNVHYNISYELLIQDEIGLSNAVLTGIKKSKGNIIVVMDGDGSHNPFMIGRMIEYIKDYDVIIGSKYVEHGENYDTFIRRIISRSFCFITQIYLGLKIKDCMSGFVIAHSDLFKELSIVEGMDYKFGLELIARNKDSVFEYPIIFTKRTSGKSKANTLQAFRTIGLILRLKSLV